MWTAVSVSVIVVLLGVAFDVPMHSLNAPIEWLFTQAPILVTPLELWARDSVLLGLAVVIAVVVFTPLWTLLFVPYEQRKLLADIEADNELSGSSASSVSAAVRKRTLGDINPPYPNGWFRIASSSDVPVGSVHHIQALGRHFALFRGEDGVARVLNAYCPHLGANLAVGGEVVGSSLRCPFHGWRFSGDTGKCEEIPYSTKPIHNMCDSSAWRVHEGNGSVHVWFHADGEPPSWDVPRHEFIDDGTWKYHGFSEHEVKAHCQEIPENGADVAHLNVLHSPFIVRWMSPVVEHIWSATWDTGKKANGQEHMSVITVTQQLTLFGIRIPGTYVHVDANQVGPGLVYLTFDTPFGKLMVLETVTPVAPLLLKATHQLYAAPNIPRWFGKFVIHSTVKQFERDVPVWNNKTFLRQPVVVSDDGPITKFRRWYKQFYSKGSAALMDQHALEW